MVHLPHFGHINNFSQKRALLVFGVYSTLTSRKYYKKVMSQSRENSVTDGWTDRLTNQRGHTWTKAGFIGPSGRSRGPKNLFH